MPTPLIPPPEYQEEIKRRFTVNGRSQTGLDKYGHELCLKPRKALTKHKPRWMLMPCSGEKSRRIVRSKIYFSRSNAFL